MAVDNTHFKGCWRPEEDEALRKAVAIHGEKNWSVVARHFNTLMGRPPLLGRAPKQCRSRYLQQLVPGIKTGEWTPEEEEILVDGHRQFGNQWTLIASMLPGRTETSVKNHYNCTARRKVPTDLSRMTILQRYLASIGVITISNAGKGGAKFPSLGSGYPSSSSSQFFHTHAGAAAAAAGGRSSGGKQAAARSAPISPSASHHYDEYDEDEQRQQMEHEQYMQQQQLAMQQHMCDEDDELHHQYEQQAQHDEHCMTEAEVTEGAAVGLLQLARAALMHMEDEEDDAAGSQQHKQEGGDDHDVEDEEAAAGSQRQQLHLKPQHSSRHSGRSSQHPPWIKPEVLPVVRSNSEDSDRTAEEEEGSPMAEANLKQQLRPSGLNSKRGSAGASQLAGGGGGKRHRSMWEQPVATPGGSGGVQPSSMKIRPVLDVSEPAFGGSLVGTAVAGEDSHSPPSPPALRGASPATMLQQQDAHTQLLALMMQAFMGAATEGSPSATALSPNHLAAVARVMALSGLGMGGQGFSGAAAAGAAAAGEAAANPMAEMLAAIVQEGAGAAGMAAGAPAAWSTSLEQHVRAAAGQ